MATTRPYWAAQPGGLRWHFHHSNGNTIHYTGGGQGRKQKEKTRITEPIASMEHNVWITQGSGLFYSGRSIKRITAVAAVLRTTPVFRTLGWLDTDTDTDTGTGTGTGTGTPYGTGTDRPGEKSNPPSQGKNSMDSSLTRT